MSVAVLGIVLLAGCAPEKIKLSVTQACIDSSGHVQATLHSDTSVTITPADVCVLFCDKDGNPVTFVPPEPNAFVGPQQVEVFLHAANSRFCDPIESSGNVVYGDGYSDLSDPEMVADQLKKYPTTATVRICLYMEYSEMQRASLSSAFDPDEDTRNHQLTVFRSEAFPIKEDRNIAAFVPAEQLPPPPPPPQVDLLDLANAYESNSIKADNQYLRQRFRVTGVVVKVGRDGDGHPFLGIAADEEGRGGAICYFSKVFEFQASDLDAGQRVTVDGTGAGSFESAPLIGECRLVNQ
jgi:hypothetical protein